MQLTEAIAIVREHEHRTRQQLAGIELVGEVGLTRPELDVLSEAFLRLGPVASPEQFPHSFALALVGTAVFDYDGELWAHVDRRLGHRNHVEIGQWFERYLRATGLPDFRYLVEQGALRYLTPILAHALIPEHLIPAFMAHVVWPAVARPDLRGSTASEVQQRVLREDPGMPRPVSRFVAYGGRTARDVVERTLAVVRAAAQGSPPGAQALPAHFEKAVLEWVDQRVVSASERTGIGARYQAPSLRYDDAGGRIVLHLPHQEPLLGALRWEVMSSTGVSVEKSASTPFWQRNAGHEEFELEEPAGALHVYLTRDHVRLRTWSFPAGSQDNPVVFFSDRTLRSRPLAEFLEGDRWYVLRPRASSIGSDGALTVEADLGSPLGSWDEYVVELLGAENCTILTVSVGESERSFRLVAEVPAARLALPPLPAILHSVDDGVVAFESALPRVQIPARQGASPEAQRYFIGQWHVVLSHDDSGERYASRPLDLGAALNGNNWEFGLEDLVPGPDVGTWDLEVSGPLGLGFSARLALLPSMTFDSSSTLEIAGSERPGRSVYVTSAADFVVLEAGDRANANGGVWQLQDRNRNGQIPFTVRDPRTSRETTAVFVLSTVHWQWTGTPTASTHEERRVFSLREFQDLRELSLRVVCPERARLRLECLSGDGESIQTAEFVCEPHRATHFRMRDFNSTLAEAGAAAYFRLSLPASGTDDSVLVGAVWHQLKLGGLAVGLDSGGIEFAWSDTEVPRSLSAVLASDSSPWEAPLSTPVITSGTSRIARFDGSSAGVGRYAFWLEEHNDWLGAAPVSRTRHLTVGTETELQSYLRNSPLGAARRVERLLLETSVPPTRSRIRALFDGMDDELVEDLLDVFVSCLSMGRAGQLMSLDWSGLAESLAQFTGDVEPFLWALANTDGQSTLVAFCGTLGVPAWRSLSRKTTPIPSHITRRLWPRWPALALITDAPRIRTDEHVRTVCSEYLGPDAMQSYRAGLVRRLSGYIRSEHFEPTPRAAGRLRGLLSSLSAPLLTPEGWEIACLRGIERLIKDEPLKAEGVHLVQSLAGAWKPTEIGLERVVGWDVLQDRPHLSETSPAAFLLTLSLATAYAQRLFARRVSLGTPPLGGKLDLCASYLSRALPEVYTHDLCVAELAVAGAIS